MSDFFRPSTQHIARRRGRCTYCGQHIERGMRYVRSTGNYDGRWFAHRFHLECNAELHAVRRRCVAARAIVVAWREFALVFDRTLG